MSYFANVSADELASHPVTRCPARRVRGIPKTMSVQTRHSMHAKCRAPVAPSRATSVAIIAKPSLRKPVLNIYRDFALRYNIPFIPVRLRYNHDWVDVICLPLAPVLSHLAL